MIDSNGHRVIVKIVDGGSEIVIQVGDQEWSPRIGSQEFDDWLDWSWRRREGEEVPVPRDDVRSTSVDGGWQSGQWRPKAPLR